MKKRRGLTLIEVIISLAIVGIISVVFLNVFTSGIKNIFSTKGSTDSYYENQKELDAKIKIIESDKNIEQEPEDIVIRVEINGEPIDVFARPIKAGEKELEIKTFVPYKEPSKPKDE